MTRGDAGTPGLAARGRGYGCVVGVRRRTSYGSALRSTDRRGARRACVVCAAMGGSAGEFDIRALFAIAEDQRVARDLTWSQVNSELGWMSLKTLLGMRERGTSSCHHVLPLIQWVHRTPESFVVGGDERRGELLPDPGPGGRWRWYWNITELREEVDARRAARGLTVAEVAAEIGTGTGQVKGLFTTRYGPTINLAMRVAHWLDRTAASFMWEHDGRGLPWSGRRV